MTDPMVLTAGAIATLAFQKFYDPITSLIGSRYSAPVNQLRATLADITAQWEILLSNQHKFNRTLGASPELPPEWVKHWLEQIQPLEAVPMTKSPNNQPTINSPRLEF
jgi:hypothetical protein